MRIPLKKAIKTIDNLQKKLEGYQGHIDPQAERVLSELELYFKHNLKLACPLCEGLPTNAKYKRFKSYSTLSNHFRWNHWMPEGKIESAIEQIKNGEIGTVSNETGFTPDQKKELLEALQGALLAIESVAKNHPNIKEASFFLAPKYIKQAIAKAKGEV